LIIGLKQTWQACRARVVRRRAWRIVSLASLAEMLSGPQPAIGGISPVKLPAYVEEILASGFPGIRPLTGRARRAQLEGYLTRVVEREFPEQGLRIRRPATLRAWLAAYAAGTAGG